MQEKLAITVLVIMLALFALVLVLYNLVKSKGESYNQIVLSHQDYESRTIPYKRGNIIDRNGTYLAISEKVYNLVVDPKQILDTEENYQYLDATLDALVECFGYKRDELQAMIEEKKDSQYVIYAKQLPAEDKEKFETYEKDKNKEYRRCRRRKAATSVSRAYGSRKNIRERIRTMSWHAMWLVLPSRMAMHPAVLNSIIMIS